MIRNFKNQLHLYRPLSWSYWKWVRLIILLSLDSVLVLVSYYFSFVVRTDDFTLGSFQTAFIKTAPFVWLFSTVVFYLAGFYSQIWRYANLQTALLIVRTLFFVSFCFFITNWFGVLAHAIPRSVPAIHFFILAIVMILAKFSWRGWLGYLKKFDSRDRPSALIYGAGEAGALFIRSVISAKEFPFRVVGLIDDDPGKKGRSLHNLRVLGGGQDLKNLAARYNVKNIIITMHRPPGVELRKVYQQCVDAGLKTLIMPDTASALQADFTKLRQINIEDLLRRAPKEVDKASIEAFFNDRTVLITGAGGSIGSELARQVINCKPRKLVLLDSSEFNLYKIGDELEGSDQSSSVSLVLGSIQSKEFLDSVFESHSPEIVIHAAAFKHVPIIESNPIQGVLNNVLGTKNLIDAADAFNVAHFLLISTDKAVRPTNIMGSTKRCCEILLQHKYASNESRTKFVAVRFGNVLGSSGSVIPKFLDQIKSGGPVTVTHPDVTRYFMLTSEAVGLVLYAVTRASGGEIFVLNMGEPVKIADMATQLVELSGKVPNKDIEIKYTGLRPGEKLYEELFLDGTEKTSLHEDIFVSMDRSCSLDSLHKKVEDIIRLAKLGLIDQVRMAILEVANTNVGPSKILTGHERNPADEVRVRNRPFH